MPKLRHLMLPLLACALPQSALAKSAEATVRLEVTARAPAFGGREFAAHGSYEQITGVAHMRIDPLAPANRGVVDLALAPRAADGMVEYDIDFIIQRPADPAKARRVLVYEVVNRGMRLMGMMTGSSAMNPNDPGDGLLMRQGFTLVASGWQGDITNKALVGARFPIATDHGKPVTGPVATETIFDDLTSKRMTLPYPVGGDDPAQTRLTVRALTASAPQTLTGWRFIDDRHIEIERPAEYDAGAIYRFEYVAKDPRVMGLGFAATRDFIAWLRHGSAAEGNPLADLAAAPCERGARSACINPAGGTVASAIAFGGSQSGRYLRDFVWRGFNRDVAGRRVFDGVIPFIPGARQTFTDFRFAEPGRFSRQHEDHDVPGFAFPFTYATLTDAVTGKTDGILKSCTASATCPKLMHIDTSGEFWQAGAGLVGTGGTGHDVPFPANVRAYMIAGGAHAPGMPTTRCRYPTNPFNYAPVVRAMMLAMADWTLGRSLPPASRWPSLARHELVPFAALHGPASQSSGLAWPKVINWPIAPGGKTAWPVLVPAVDADGIDAAGIHLPDVAAPTGTYLGWNLRKPGFADGDLCFPEGSWVPFASDAASRGDDPRASLAERYPQPGDRAARRRAVARQLQAARLILPEDANKAIAAEAGQP